LDRLRTIRVHYAFFIPVVSMTFFAMVIIYAAVVTILALCPSCMFGISLGDGIGHYDRIVLTAVILIFSAPTLWPTPSLPA
jgi:hypothetical protein